MIVRNKFLLTIVIEITDLSSVGQVITYTELSYIICMYQNYTKDLVFVTIWKRNS